MDELCADPDVRIRHVLADKVERHVLKCLPGVTGRYSCERCLCPGLGTSVGWPYPYATMFPLRDSQSFAAQAR